MLFRSGVDSKFQQWGNSKATSVWGLAGEEDFGGGNKIYFQLESELNPETGEGGDALFGEAAYIGIAGNFGSVQAGRQSTVNSNILGEYDVSGAPALTSSLGNAGVSGDAQRYSGETYSSADSALLYISPDFSGFSFQAALVLKNDAIISAGKNVYSVGAVYEIGDFSVGAAFESKLADGMSASWGLGASYDFGSFLVAASYFDNHLDADGKGFSVGVIMPINAFEVGVQIAYNTDASDGADDIEPLAWELFANYNLSKRTQLYAQYGGMNKDAQTFNDASRKYSASFGIIHNF